jgi:tetratricopeptide (TPR) repeat protein
MASFCFCCLRATLFLVVLTSALESSSRAQPAPLAMPKPAALDRYSGEAIVVEKNETAYRMKDDGTGERSLYVRMRLQSEGAVRQFSVLAFAYAAASETPHILSVKVTKPDGTIVETPVTETIEMPSPVTREAPLYSDSREQQLPVRSLAVGDTLEYRVRTTIDKPEAPGQFWGADHFTAPGTLVVLSEVFTLEVPQAKYVQIWSPNHKPVRGEHEGLVTYTWDIAQLLPTPTQTQRNDAKTRPPKDPDQDAEGRLIPSLAYTTFHSWAEVGDWYRGLSAARAEPTAVIRAKADALTTDAKTPEEQARALYRFVSAIRYIGIDLGVGRFQPHPAAEVLADQYGDCKDKDTLLEALMRAKGLHPAPALIGAGITPLPDVPTPAVFNHVITTLELPGMGRVWMDATAETAPFRLLNPVLRDEEALVVPLSGVAELVKTPADAPYPFYNSFQSTGTLSAEGVLKARVDLVFHSDDEAPLRNGVQQLAPAQWDAGAQYLVSSMGFSGKVANADLKQKGQDDPLRLSYDYTREKYTDWDNLRILPLAPGLYLPEPDADDPTLMNVQLGAKTTQTVSSRLTLPPGFRADLPDGVHASSPWVTYDKTYRVSDGVLIFDRKVVVLETKVPRSDFAAYRAFLKKISNGNEYYVQLTALHTAKPESATPAAPETAPSDGPEELVQQAMVLAGSRDWSGAASLLDRAKEVSDSTPYLWAGYGSIQAGQEHFEAAIPLLRRELARHPDESRVVAELAYVLNKDHQESASRTLLADYFKDHTDDRTVGLMLAESQTTAQQYGDSAQTLQLLSTALPKDESIKVRLADTFLLDGKKTEAAKVAKAALEAAEPEDSSTMNDAAYALAETGSDLPSAEEFSRKAVSLLEAKSRTLTADQVNSRSYADANLLIASWDTLGFIFLQEGKLDQALNWLAPAWYDSQHAEVGLHLGEVEEKLGKSKEAITTYRLALASHEGARAEKVLSELRAALARLHGQAEDRSDAQQLQRLRMFRFTRPAGLDGQGTYRILLASSGVVDLQQASGDSPMKKAEPAIRAMTFPDLIPSGSKVNLLRRIVVSCRSGASCQLVFVPNGQLSQETD